MNCRKVVIFLFINFFVQLLRYPFINGIVLAHIMEIHQNEDYEVDCIKQLSRNYFHSNNSMSGSLVVMSITSNPTQIQSSLIHAFHADNKHEFSVMIKDAHKPHYNSSHVSEKAKNYFMFFTNSTDLNSTVHQWKSLNTWNPSAQVVCLFTQNFTSSISKLHSDLRRLFTDLLKFGMLNVNVITHQVDTVRMQTYTWYPYGQNNCAKHVENILIIDECEYDA